MIDAAGFALFGVEVLDSGEGDCDETEVFCLKAVLYVVGDVCDDDDMSAIAGSPAELLRGSVVQSGYDVKVCLGTDDVCGGFSDTGVGDTYYLLLVQGVRYV